MLKKPFLQVEKFTFGDIQLRVHQSFKGVKNIEDKYETFKKEHYNMYKAAISNYNTKCFPSIMTKKTLNSFFTNKVAPEPPSTEKAFKDLEECLPTNPSFHDILKWIARNHIISHLKDFTDSISVLDNSQLVVSNDDTDIDSALNNVTSEIQLDSSILNISGISVSGSAAGSNSSLHDLHYYFSEIEVAEGNSVDIESVDVSQDENDRNGVREDVFREDESIIGTEFL
jgi:hypothetical protein